MTTTERLFALETFGIKLGLDNIRALTSALGHPERAYHTVHVAGTNGKGSVSAMVEHGLRAQGYRTGLYTSPHLDRIEERAAVDGAAVAPEQFESCARDVLAVVDALASEGRLPVSPTFFEVTTAIAFEVFRRAGVEVAVVEVGLGGRHDATNVVEPMASAITSIAFDHEQHLGRTLAAIAAEKAGIARRGVPLVLGDLPPEAREVVLAVAREAGAPVVEAGGAIRRTDVTDGVATVWAENSAGGFGPVRLALRGRHQAGNAAVAIQLMRALDAHGLRMSSESLVAGLSQARWPGRLEWLKTGGGTLLIDAAHNPAGTSALATYLLEAGVSPLPIALAMMEDKDVAGMVGPLAGVASRFVATEAASARSLRAGALAVRLADLAPGLAVEVEPDPARAAAVALADGRAVAAGSIYFTGPLRARLIEAGAQSI
ncbi:MAG: Mur ligase family protein [Acidobacteriota bacterium]|nr:Mur ligase family protein [Acidobacteriota bacterium]